MMVAMALCFPQSVIANWQTDRTKYYDFDGDKQLEWDKDLWIYKYSQTDGSIVKVAEKPHRLAVWTNVNNDEYIDWHRLNGANHFFYCGTDYAKYHEISVRTQAERFPFDYNNDGYPDWIDSGHLRTHIHHAASHCLTKTCQRYWFIQAQKPSKKNDGTQTAMGT